jgi:Leucine-rich repeat (LRR) protein
MRHYIVITTLLLLPIVNTLSSPTLVCDFGKVLSTYSCNPISVNPQITLENEEIIVNGSHLSGLTDDDITYVRLNSPLTFRFVPTQLFEVFPNLETFGLQSVNLTRLTSGAFSNCFKMKSLTIDGNKGLKEIPEAFAEECGSLKNLYMPGNGIVSIDKNAFTGLHNLLYLVLTQNNIEQLHAETFNHVRNLQHLFIDYNRLKHLESGVFYPLRRLQLLSATHNAIEELSLAPFRNNPLLDALFFDYNEIIAIESDFFAAFPGNRESYEIRFCGNNCTGVVLSSEDERSENFDVCIEKWNKTHSNEVHVEFGLTTAPPTISTHKRDCRYFLNEHRKYTCVLECVDLVLTAIGGPHYEQYSDMDVTQVFFTDSVLSRVPSILYEKFPNLEFLSVARTQMAIINDQTFGECGRLQKIDASGNKITQIVETSLRNCTELLTIDVSGNPIEFVDGELFAYDPQLKHIILQKKF